MDSRLIRDKPMSDPVLAHWQLGARRHISQSNTKYLFIIQISLS